MKNKNIAYYLFISTACISTVNAQLFSDNFERADVAQTTDASEVGNNWNYPSTSGTWGIDNGVLVTDLADDGAQKIFNTGNSISISNTDSLTYSVDIFSSTGTGWLGITFNQQDTNNFDVVRFSLGDGRHQSYRAINGTPTSATGGGTGDGDPVFQREAWYTISVTTNVNEVLGDISYTITERDTGTIVNTFNRSFGAEPEDWTNNYFGILATTNGTPAFDNYTVVPEPKQASMLIGFLSAAFVLIARRHIRKQA